MSRGKSSVVFLGFAAMATVACPLAAGCMADGDASEVASDEGATVEVAKLALTTDPPDPPAGSNPFYPECFWNHATQQTYRDLALGALGNAQGQLPSMPHMALTALPVESRAVCREQALRYLIQCALPQNESLTDPADNVIYYGHYGVAPEWQSASLGATNKEWITSCLLQHLNGFQTSTALLLEGKRNGFYIDTVAAGYAKRDSITWGNLFSTSFTQTLDPTGWNSNSRPAFEANVCYFSDLNYACDNVHQQLRQKFCGGLQASCGEKDRGLCVTACPFIEQRNGLPSEYWTCDGKITSFRERLPNFNMYGNVCQNPY